MKKSNIWIVDFGSQYTQLITRKTRELGYLSEIISIEMAKELFENGKYPMALVFSGGPQSIFEDKTDYAIFFQNKNLPILGICYGMQLIASYFGGEVKRGVLGEYGPAIVNLEPGVLAYTQTNNINVWMSHADHVENLPKKFVTTMKTNNNLIAGMRHTERPILGLQFHPEVDHTEYGKDILNYYYQHVAELKKDWDRSQMLEEAYGHVKNVSCDYVLCAFSGGVDSLVAATLTHNIIGDKLYCFFVDNGLLRPQDYHHIELLKKETKLNIEVIDAKQDFYNALEGLFDPEKKRKAIGVTFINIFEKKVHHFEREHKIYFKHLLQGTLYPDVIESLSPLGKNGKSSTIKSHHNVGGLPEKMNLTLLEPLKLLFKDEVRAMGIELGLKHSWIYRHPFPGPGIGIRILGEINLDSIKKVQASDQILFEELHNHNLYQSTWQAFTVFLPIKTVGVKGDARAYENVICLRMVDSSDGMTAQWSQLPAAFLTKVSNRITNEIAGITRVVYDITSKPPGTIEWE